MSEYWDEDGQAAAGGSKEDEEDDEIEAKGSPGERWDCSGRLGPD